MKNSLLALTCFTLLLSACGDNRSQRGEELDTEQIQYPIPKAGDIRMDKHGLEKKFAYGAMSGVQGVPANGVTQSHVFEDGFFLHTITLNIAPAEEGYFYEGWLVNADSVVSTGHLSSYFGDARHSLRFESATEYSDHLKVIVTLEPDDGNLLPAGHVAEGVLKVTKR